MAIDKEGEAKILRYHFVEHWGVHTIASQLGIHYSTVDRVLSQAGLPKAERAPAPSMIDPYVPFILETLRQYSRLTAARLYSMVLERGYTGGASHFRARVAQLRPRRPAEAYLRLKTLPGEQAQVDWALCRSRHKAHNAELQIMPSKNLKMGFRSCIYDQSSFTSRFHSALLAGSREPAGTLKVDHPV